MMNNTDPTDLKNPGIHFGLEAKFNTHDWSTMYVGLAIGYKSIEDPNLAMYAKARGLRLVVGKIE